VTQNLECPPELIKAINKLLWHYAEESLYLDKVYTYELNGN